MSQKLQMLEMFRKNNNEITLGEIMKTTLGCEYRARMSDLRRDGVNIVFTRGKAPSENLYTLIPNEFSRKLQKEKVQEDGKEGFHSQLAFNWSI